MTLTLVELIVEILKFEFVVTSIKCQECFYIKMFLAMKSFFSSSSLKRKTIHIVLGSGNKTCFTKFQNEYRQYNWSTYLILFSHIPPYQIRSFEMFMIMTMTWQDIWLMTCYVLQMIYKVGKVWLQKNIALGFFIDF